MAHKKELTQSHSLIVTESHSPRTDPSPSLSVRFGPFISDLHPS